MSNYLSDFIRRFGGANLGFAAISDTSTEKSTRPHISYVTLYNPLWAPQNDESLSALSKQILFFIKPKTDQNGESSISDSFESYGDAELEEKLNTIGLIRGSGSLASEFGHSTQAVSIHVSDGVILCVEIEKDYFLSMSVSGKCGSDANKDVYGQQLEIMVQEWHATFLLFHSSFEKLRNMHGDSTFKQMLKEHWGSFMNYYNCGSEPHFGPANLCWPNRTNNLGVFRFLPENSYKVSSIKLPEAQKAKLDETVFGGEVSPSAILVANVSKDTPKKRGIIYTHYQPSLNEKEAHLQMLKTYNIFECLDSNGCLEAQNISPKIERIYEILTRKWQKEKEESSAAEVELDLEDDELPDVSMSSYASTMDALHPATITNKLIVSPINETINGFKYLGSAVSEQITTAPSWFHTWSEPTSNEPNIEDSCSEPDSPKGKFLVGLKEDEITRLLIQIPLNSSGEKIETVEMSLVIFLEDETLTILAFESGMEQLERREFYNDLQNSLLEGVMEFTRTSHMSMGNSIGSLKDSIGIEVRDSTAGSLHEEVESGFFYIVYDTETKSYRSSLPTLPTFLRPHEPVPSNKRSLYKIIFHLHDRLIAHFVCKSRGRVFAATSVSTESLHKFSSRKSGDWMFYLIRHENKIIIIVKDSNSKAKARVASEREENYFIKVADSLYGAANLGFLDSLGEDVRIWLGGLSEGKT